MTLYIKGFLQQIKIKGQTEDRWVAILVRTVSAAI